MIRAARGEPSFEVAANFQRRRRAGQRALELEVEKLPLMAARAFNGD